jgi:hypothetical protein
MCPKWKTTLTGSIDVATRPATKHHYCKNCGHCTCLGIDMLFLVALVAVALLETKYPEVGSINRSRSPSIGIGKHR